MQGGVDWRSTHRLAVRALMLGLLGWSGATAAPAPTTVPGRAPLVFEPNQGQSDAAALYVSRGAGQSVLFTRREVVVLLSREAGAPHPLRLRLAGGNPSPEVAAGEPLPGRSHYYRGRDPRRWTVDVPQFGTVRYEGVYEGVDVVYYGNDGRLEYDFMVAPGADPTQIRLEFGGADVSLVDGELKLATPAGELLLQRPVTYQSEAGVRQPVASEYVLLADGQVGIRVAAYDGSRPLVIDPILGFSSYYGGDAEDNGGGVHVDDTGIYFGGLTASTDLPGDLPGGSSVAPERAGGLDAYAVKLDPTGTQLIYATYFGGSDDEIQRDLVADGSGNVYLIGETLSDDLPMTQSAFDAACGTDGQCDGGHEDIFLAKLDQTGTLEYATYIGGSDQDIAGKVDVDPLGNVFISGYSLSTDFPVTAGAFDTSCGTDGQCNGDNWDAVVVSVDASGSALNYATYLGGSKVDRGFALAVDDRGRAFVAGSTFSPDFPVTVGAYDELCGGDGQCDGTDDAFIVSLVPSGTSLEFGTFLGGSGDGESQVSDERIWSIAVDEFGNTYVTGRTDSPDFPRVGALAADSGGAFGGLDAFVTRLRAFGSSLDYSTYLGGSGYDEGLGIDVDPYGNAVVTGVTTSTDFPLVDFLTSPGNECRNCVRGFTEAFAVRIDSEGARLLYSSYLGGNSSEFGSDIVATGSGDAVVLGDTYSSTSESFPTVNAIQDQHGAGANWDTFVARLETDDTDGDTVDDPQDNCTEAPNEGQRDTDGDGYGNFCDADLNNDLRTNSFDLIIFLRSFRTRADDPHSDFNGDGRINLLDLNIMLRLFRSPPGPSALAP